MRTNIRRPATASRVPADRPMPSRPRTNSMFSLRSPLSAVSHQAAPSSLRSTLPLHYNHYSTDSVHRIAHLATTQVSAVGHPRCRHHLLCWRRHNQLQQQQQQKRNWTKRNKPTDDKDVDLHRAERLRQTQIAYFTPATALIAALSRQWSVPSKSLTTDH